MKEHMPAKRQSSSTLPLGRSLLPVRTPLQPKEAEGIGRSPKVPIAEKGHSFSNLALTPIQAKLTIGAPNDRYEQEADRVAKQVVQRLNTPTVEATQPEGNIQRKPKPEDKEELQRKPIQMRGEAIGGGEASPDLTSAINRARGSGQPLAAGLQQSMGQAMGADFRGVRVHADAQADQLNRSIQAKAFTTGRDVFFRQGAYQPGNRRGQELIAHELTHVVQQSSDNGTQHIIHRFYLENAQQQVSWVAGNADPTMYELSPNTPHWWLGCIPYALYRAHTIDRPAKVNEEEASAPRGLTQDRAQVNKRSISSKQNTGENPDKLWRQACNQIDTTIGAPTNQQKRKTIFKKFYPQAGTKELDQLETKWKQVATGNDTAIRKGKEAIDSANDQYARTVTVAPANPLPQRNPVVHRTADDVGRHNIETLIRNITTRGANRGMHPMYTARRVDRRVINGPEVRLDREVGERLFAEYTRLNGQPWEQVEGYSWAVHRGGGANHASWYINLGHQETGRRISDTIIHINYG